MKITKNRPFFKEKVKLDGYSIKQAFKFEPQSEPFNWVNFKNFNLIFLNLSGWIAIFHAKLIAILSFHFALRLRR
ncbi:hypothetical protein B0182_05440 [Moraxella bovis]|nr:hypothetical protein B0182_05440 [Moraxella bovis]